MGNTGRRKRTPNDHQRGHRSGEQGLKPPLTSISGT
uniref:Uncharacterized protein n=1 Tax=Anguilla anguilla TaxID=7936 RepID=A0A0E9VKR5_ANGAN